jgi:hypothetical protein
MGALCRGPRVAAVTAAVEARRFAREQNGGMVMSTQDRLHRSSARDSVPLKSNVGLIAGLVVATAGFVAIFVYYL